MIWKAEDNFFVVWGNGEVYPNCRYAKSPHPSVRRDVGHLPSPKKRGEIHITFFLSKVT